jgi:multiple sugar transport system permease protein
MVKQIAVKKLLLNFSIYIVIIIFLFFTLLPIFWMVRTSFIHSADAFLLPPKLFFKPILDNYTRIFQGGYMTSGTNFVKAYINSIIISVSSSLLSLMIGIPAAYSLARFQFKAKNDLSFWILTTRMAPPLGAALPLYMLFRWVNLLDTHLCLIILYLTFNISLVIWLLTGFFQGIPKEIEEASFIDGCSRLGALLRVIIPICLPGIIAAVIICFIFSWNEFLFALITTGVRAQTVPIGAYSLILHTRVLWGPITAAGVTISLPIIAFVVIFQKQLVTALTFGAIR